MCSGPISKGIHQPLTTAGGTKPHTSGDSIVELNVLCADRSETVKPL